MGDISFGVLVFTASRLREGLPLAETIKSVFSFALLFGCFNTVATIALTVFKKQQLLSAYISVTSYLFILPLYSYFSLGRNHHAYPLGIVVLIFSILYRRKSVVVYTGILIWILIRCFSIYLERL